MATKTRKKKAEEPRADRARRRGRTGRDPGGAAARRSTATGPKPVARKPAVPKTSAPGRAAELPAREPVAAAPAVAADPAPPRAANPEAPERILAALLRCPATHHAGFEVGPAEVWCERSGRAWPVVDGVVDFVGGPAADGGLFNRLMHAPFYAPLYEEVFRPGLTRIVTPQTLPRAIDLSLAFANPRPGMRVLDAACGTGNFTRPFALQVAAQGGLTIGVDLSWPMLRRAERERLAAGIERLRFLRADIFALPFRDGSFDVVHCTGALHLLPDTDAALREFARVARPGGVLVVGTFVQSRFRPVRALERASVPITGFRWFARDHLYAAVQRAGFDVLEEVIERAAISLSAIRRPG